MSVSTQPTSASLSDEDAKLWQEIKMPPPPPGMTPEEIMAYRETEEGKKLQAWIEQKFNAARDARQREERQWNLNLAMYNSNQNIRPYAPGTDYSGLLGEPRAGSNRQRQIINRIKPVIRTEMSKFISQKPGATVVPATDEDEDILAAKAGEDAWYATSTRNCLDDHFRNAIWWMCITGNGFLKTTWNTSKEDTDSGIEGDVEYGSVKPYELFFADLNAKDIQAQPFIIHAYAKSTEALRLQYKEVLKDKKLQSTCKEASIQEAAYAAPKKSEEPSRTFDSNMLIEFWCKPGFCEYLPDGGVITLIDKIIVGVVNTGLPYDHGQYPFEHFAHIETERFYRTSIIDDLIDLQRDYNSLRSQIAESRKKMGKPQILSPKGAISASKMTNEIGLVVEYKMGMQPPQPMPIQNLPTYILQEVDFILRDIEDISGQHEVSKGQTPPGVTAATAISYLQESDDSYQLPSFKNIESAYGRVAKQTLQLLVQYWDEPHVIKVVGKEDAFSVRLLEGADIKRGTDVRIEPGSSLPQSKAARQAFIMDLMTNQFVPPEDGLDMLEIGGTQKLMDMLKNDKRQAQRENIKVGRLTPVDIEQYQMLYQQTLQEQGIDPNSIDPSTGMPLQMPLIIPVHTYDNHEVHIEEHNRYRKGQEFESLPPEVQAVMEAHVNQHKTMMQQDMLQQTMSQIPSDGSVDEGGAVDGTVSDQGQADFGQSGAEVPTDLPNGAPGAPTDTQPAPVE